jgi:tetratricopeptide (TPR) repeat protein
VACSARPELLQAGKHRVDYPVMDEATAASQMPPETLQMLVRVAAFLRQRGLGGLGAGLLRRHQDVLGSQGRLELGWCILQSGDLDAALLVADDLLTAHPGMATAFTLRATALLYLGEPAGEAARTAVERSPADPSARLLLSVAAYEEGDAWQAAEAAAAAVSLAPLDASARLQLARAVLATGRLDDAIVSYNRAVELAPGWPLPRAELGDALLHRGRRVEAAATFGEGLRRFPTSTALAAGLAQATDALGPQHRAVLLLILPMLGMAVWAAVLRAFGVDEGRSVGAGAVLGVVSAVAFLARDRVRRSQMPLEPEVHQAASRARERLADPSEQRMTVVLQLSVALAMAVIGSVFLADHLAWGATSGNVGLVIMAVCAALGVVSARAAWRRARVWLRRAKVKPAVDVPTADRPETCVCDEIRFLAEEAADSYLDDHLVRGALLAPGFVMFRCPETGRAWLAAGDAGERSLVEIPASVLRATSPRPLAATYDR